MRLFIVEGQAEEAEPDDGPQFVGETAEQRLAIVISPQRFRHADATRRSAPRLTSHRCGRRSSVIPDTSTHACSWCWWTRAVMVRSHCPPKRAVRRDACEQGVPRLISEPTRPLKVRIDACCGVAPERSVRSNQRVDLGGRQLDTLIAQRRQCADPDRSRNSDGIPRRSPGDRRSVERFSKTCVSQWRSRGAYGRQQASPRSNPDRVGMACCAESREQCP